ncbi:hypothetical protein GCM10025331_83350 [Actinoplanes utahensis]|nr:hypothetical protein Aut01nite_84730 [Actinoplanes utahensis]
MPRTTAVDTVATVMVSRRVPPALDVLLAVAVMAAAVFRTPAGGVAVWMPAVLLGLPLAARRRRPELVLAVTTVTAAVAVLAGTGADVAMWALALALYPVAGSARSPVWCLPAALAGILLPGAADAATGRLPLIAAPEAVESFSTTPLPAAAMTVTVITGSWVLARAVRARRRHAAELARLRTAQAITEERLRIARDVHDVVGHNLSLIAMDAAVAQHLGTGQAAALRTIEQVSRAALSDVRAVLGGLRTFVPGPARLSDESALVPGAGGLSGESAFAPGSARLAGRSTFAPESGGRSGEFTSDPGLAGLDALIDATRAVGVRVTVDRSSVSAVPAAVQTSAYRIVQEALTNVRRHSGARSGHVTVTASPDALTLSVTDGGRDTPPASGAPGVRDGQAAPGPGMAAGRDGSAPPGKGMAGVQERDGVAGVCEGGAQPAIGVAGAREGEVRPVRGLRGGDGRRGFGLAGMRERAGLHGGTLTAGPEPGGGFAVRATLPYAA